MFMPIFLLGFLLVFHSPSAEGVCCHSVCSQYIGVWIWRRCIGFECKDGTKPTPYCGHRPCNVFGCNCGGGCREASGRSLEVEREEGVLDELLAFKSIDTNGDGMIDMGEASASVEQLDLENFQEIDLNGDGKISPLEFDAGISEEAMRML